MDSRRGVRARRRARRELRAWRPGVRAPSRRAGPHRRAGAQLPDAGDGAVRLSPTLEALRVYPFVRLTQAKNERLAHGEQVVDFGIGEPREQTPAFIRAALADAIEPMSTYPSADGLPELREAIAAWVGRRFGAALDPATEVIPTLGSKEAIFHLAQIVGPGRVALTVPGYPVPERGALFAGREVVEAPLLAERGFLPDLEALPLGEL